MNKDRNILRTGVILAVVGILIVLIVTATFKGHSFQRSHVSTDKRISPSVAPIVSAVATVPAPRIPAPAPEQEPDAVILRPLPVARRSGTHEWTAEDATQPEIIEKIAHNPDEFIRLVEENARIKRRQLVYRNETVPMLVERARASGQPLKSFTLPGLDGREVEVEVTGIQEHPNLNGGTVNGRVKNRSGSMVAVGFSNGCESFNVLSPEDGLFLTADAREPGEVLVKEIDPNEYNPPAGSTPDFILTNKPVPEGKSK